MTEALAIFAGLVLQCVALLVAVIAGWFVSEEEFRKAGEISAFAAMIAIAAILVARYL